MYASVAFCSRVFFLPFRIVFMYVFNCGNLSFCVNCLVVECRLTALCYCDVRMYVYTQWVIVMGLTLADVLHSGFDDLNEGDGKVSKHGLLEGLVLGRLIVI